MLEMRCVQKLAQRKEMLKNYDTYYGDTNPDEVRSKRSENNKHNNNKKLKFKNSTNKRTFAPASSLYLSKWKRLVNSFWLISAVVLVDTIDELSHFCTLSFFASFTIPHAHSQSNTVVVWNIVHSSDGRISSSTSVVVWTQSEKQRKKRHIWTNAERPSSTIITTEFSL